MPAGSDCSQSLKLALDTFYLVNPYDILVSCFLKEQGPSDVTQRASGPTTVAHGGWRGIVGHTVPCADRRAALHYLSMPEVRQAIHAAPVHVVFFNDWWYIVIYTIKAPISNIDLHKGLISEGEL